MITFLLRCVPREGHAFQLFLPLVIAKMFLRNLWLQDDIIGLDCVLHLISHKSLLHTINYIGGGGGGGGDSF